MYLTVTSLMQMPLMVSFFTWFDAGFCNTVGKLVLKNIPQVSFYIMLNTYIEIILLPLKF